MVRRIFLALLAAASVPAAWWLRTQQLASAYDPESGLPLPMSRTGWALWGLFAALALLTLLLALPEKAGRSLSALRPVAIGAIFQGAGALLLTFGAGWRLYELYPALRSLAALGAAALLLGGLGLFDGLRACFGGEKQAGSLLLMPMFAAALQLGLIYHANAADPVVQHYALPILTLATATLAAASLAGLALGAGGRRRALLFCAITPPLCAAALCSASSYGASLMLTGCALAAFGFFLSLLFGISRKQHPVYELVDDPFHTGPVPKAQGPAEAPAPERRPEPPRPAEPAPAASRTAPVIPEKPAAAQEPAKEPEFDLSRVDRLLHELNEERDSLRK